ncbi:Na+/H+ antiporter [Haliscomenobacter hydrossis]|uniref:Na+/H+ antiporter n=1 Tax=Haliscomenobacter hydrossis (strain ATCC 27775 / DSM 1100 / LMG 10767 / O) TaxID=760192 RepID=F4KUR9_HALH1|nr:Na+/H+ antiporter [Haliscomenobacter hydrossis]AEE53472.1 Na+/H+ antiporter [Haliscomenobacter hydrossis DSM 1100]
MLLNNLLLIIILLMVVSLFSMLSEKLRISYPIFLVICGLFIGFIPNVLDITLKPDLVFLIFLPPLLYAAAWNTSWKDFWALRRSISLLALGLVIFTSCAVAIVSHMLIPGFSLALGFLLGGIISPPDAIAATSVLQKLKIPKRVVSILEGESLVNDAASLIVFRFALAAVLTHKFVLLEAGIDFVVVVTAGILIGLAIAFFIYAFHRFLPTTSSIDTAITLIAPYLMYVTAEHFHFSGVLAVVSGGLFLSSRSTEVFSFSTRLQSQGVWDTLVFLLNGVVFVLIGLQLPLILKSLDPGTITHAIYYGVIISFVTILVRIIWVFPAAYLPRLLSKKIKTNESYPGWKSVLIIAWSGMRGVVSLAAALSIPLTLSSGEAFPQRNLILFISFIVILCTLVLQGLSLPFLVSKLDFEIKDNETEQELEIQMHLVSSVLAYINTRYAQETETDNAFRMLKKRYEHLQKTQKKQLHIEDDMPSYISAYRTALLELVEVRRKALEEMNGEKKYPEELIRRLEKVIDHEEAGLSMQLK